MVKRAAQVLWPPAATFMLVTAAAEAIVRLGWVSEYLVPAPSSVFASLTHDAALWRAMVVTTKAALIGFALSAAVGVAAAVILSSSRWIQRAFYPYAIFFQTVPIVAIAPLLVIWCRNGLQAVVASAFIVSVFPVVAGALTGLLSVDPALRDLFRLHQAGALATLWKLKLPSALPSILTGFRVAAGLAVIGAIVGEFIAGSSDGGWGLGIMIQTVIKQQDTPAVFAAILLSSLLGLALFGAINLAGYLLLRRWHASEQNG